MTPTAPFTPAAPDRGGPGQLAKPPLAVLCLSGSLGGLELNSLKFARWMQERGWPVTFIGLPGTPLAALAAEWAVPSLLPAVRRGLGLPLTAWALGRQLRRLGIEVLVVTQNKDLALATLSKQLMGGRLRVLYQQHMQLGRPKRSPVHRLRFRQLDAWLTPLPGLGQEVLRWTHLATDRLHVVPLGLPLEQFAPPARTQSQARQELDLPAQGHLLGILGRFDKGKGQDFVIEALHRLRSEFGHDAGLLVMGEPTRNEGDTYYQQLQQQVRRLGLEAHVHFRGFRPNPDVFYQAIDVFVMASENETYGMVTLEAMAASVPVVGAAAAGTAELVQDGHNGLLFPLRDVAAGALALHRCLADAPATRQRVETAQLECWRYSHHHQCALTEAVIWGFYAKQA